MSKFKRHRLKYQAGYFFFLYSEVYILIITVLMTILDDATIDLHFNPVAIRITCFSLLSYYVSWPLLEIYLR
uniref:Uncharacterized protein n=1 Tax=Arundo donax TaxID=35708 RepID=A0A0A9D173_ARUDO